MVVEREIAAMQRTLVASTTANGDIARKLLSNTLSEMS
jgi:hypothetical protein